VARPGVDRSGRTARRSRRTLTVRGDRDRAVDGATVVRAVVHARLLGLRLLTLDARVVVAPAKVEPGALDPMIPVPVAVDHEAAPRDEAGGAMTPVGPGLAGRPPPPSVDGGVTRARELLAEGTHTLAQSTRETFRSNV
jgi:hypothetical protein